MKDFLEVMGFVFLVFVVVLVGTTVKLKLEGWSPLPATPPEAVYWVDREYLGRVLTGLTTDAWAGLYRFTPEPGVRCYLLVPGREQFTCVVLP